MAALSFYKSVVGRWLSKHGQPAVEHPGSDGVAWQNALVELHVIVRYLSLLLYPASQSIVQPVYPIASISDPRVVTSVGILLFIAVMAADLRKRAPMVRFGAAWFLVLLVPSASLIILAAVGEPMAEHRVYLASAGLFMAVAAITVHYVDQGRASARDRLRAASAARRAPTTTKPTFRRRNSGLSTSLSPQIS